MQLKPVGFVRSSITQRADMRTWGAPASVEVLPEFAPALHRIEKHTHLWVLAWLDSDRDRLQVIPRGLKDTGPEALHGVFSVRSPARPNPVAMTVARVESFEGLTIQFDRLDFIDGTPVVDLKPYFASRDLIFSARNEKVGIATDLGEGLMIQAVNFHGKRTPEVELAVNIVAAYLAHAPYPESWHVAAPSNRPELIDALMGITRVSLGRGTLKLHESGTVFLNGREFPLPAATT